MVEMVKDVRTGPRSVNFEKYGVKIVDILPYYFHNDTPNLLNCEQFTNHDPDVYHL